MRTSLPLLAIAGLLGVASGCSVIVGDEVNDLRPDLNAKRDVTVSLRDFGAHMGQLLDVRFVSTENQQLDGHVVVDPVPSNCLDMRLTRGAAFVASQVDFYADLNMNGMLDPPTRDGDHTWRLPLDDSGRLLFVHDTNFADITMQPAQFVLNDLEVTITGMEAFDGAQVVTLLVEDDLVDPVMNLRRRSVRGMHVTRVAAGTLTVSLAGVADPGEFYDVEFLVGDNDQSCVLSEQTTSGSNSLEVTTDFASLDCAPAEAVDCGALSAACDANSDACPELVLRCPFVDCAR